MSRFYIRRPIVAIVIAIITVIVGVVSMLTLPTAQYPNIVPPEIMVQATYPGADAKTLAQAVATPIEQVTESAPFGARALFTICAPKSWSTLSVQYALAAPSSSPASAMAVSVFPSTYPAW